MKLLAECRLYSFVDTAFLHGRPPEAVAEDLCRGGSDVIQLRAKNSTPEEVLVMARRILPITRQAGVALVINDHPSIAAEIGAEYCHLGQEDFFDAGISRPSRGENHAATGLGLSTHSPAQAGRALAADPDYIAIGPVYATGTKPGATPVTLEYVRWAAEHVKIPWFAIGGINLDNIAGVLAAGARRVCVVSAILDSPDITRACREFKNRLEGP